MQLRYDSEADAIFLALRAPEGGETGGQRLDEVRIAHRDQAGHIFAYEFLRVSQGVSFEGIEEQDADRIRQAVKPVIQLTVA